MVRIGQGGLVLAALFMAWQMKRIADRPPDNHEVNQEVNVPEQTGENDPHEEGHPDDGYGESG